ncbi:type II secretion system secretin GspD [Pseudoxanthomonas sp. PXM03]|jgi:general secretion pathway protein D|uniref:type II secretion system secretin GspD n=1 Tax=Pseudoxanthomonas sp. PXM03 TaxID=2769284 RepID=UPI0017815C4E|nr:type II secretion system secretin GspD [Pseudoxanthomonas sp. PXM03]MBD9435125.1 type II secretion system secretin GspD [Pseudoxanthomonas sp. PXM03]
MTPRVILFSLCLGLLAGCASAPVPDVRRSATTPPGEVVPGSAQTAPLAEAEAPVGGPQAQIRRGSGQMINRSAAAAPMPSLGSASSGSATFNFEGESVHAVVKAILGDMLGQNYVIAPGVQGTVTLGTPKPVSPAEALNLLEMVLGWNNARLVYSGGRYNIVPADQALAGSVAPGTGSPANARGFEVRVVPLRFISASEMKKVLEPYARPNAIVNTDATRNVITLAGTRSELENYLRTVEIFDVDWLSGMSVGVFPLQSGRATRVVADLEKVFGNDSKTPSAGMFRFMPLEGANAVLVITPQPAYLDQIQQWLERIDGAGEGSRLFSYELKYVKARELAQRLAEVFGASGSGSGGDDRSTGGPGNVSLMPGTDPVQINDGGMGGTGGSVDFGGSGSSGSGGGGLGGGSLSLNQRDSGNGAVTLDVDGSRVGVAAVEETNTLLVRASASAWQSIREVVEKLDVMPLQVHIEAQIAEVSLTGDLSYGVNWYLERAMTDNGLGPFAAPGAGGPSKWSTLAGSIGGVGGAGAVWTLVKNDAAAVITALDEVSDVRLLQTPSIFVRNNAEATLNVGSRIPISSVTVNPGLGTDNTYSQVQYLDTGVILKVRPRVTRDGMVFLDIVQEVSSPGSEPDANGNVRINTRRFKTEGAVQAGNTVMLAGLISDTATQGSSGIPGLSRLPIIGGLFGRKTTGTERSEVIVLLTPTIVSNPQEANDLTDEYGKRFRALEPLNTPRDK